MRAQLLCAFRGAARLIALLALVSTLAPPPAPHSAAPPPRPAELAPTPSRPSHSEADPERSAAVFGMPRPVFVENRGQADARAEFYLRGAGYTLWFTRGGILSDFVRANEERGGFERLVLAQDFLEANPNVALEARDAQPGTFNFFLGNDHALWRTGVRGYAELVYRNVWEGIDLRLYASAGGLEQEFLARPGADLSRIRAAYRGITGLSVAPEGSLVIATAFGALRESAPRVYQEIDGQRVEVAARFKALGAAYGFDLGPFQPEVALVIDPALDYSTFLGGSAFDRIHGLAADADGNTYVTGETASSDFPVTPGSYDTSLADGGDAFIAKLNPDGSGLVYATFLGGGGSGAISDTGLAIAVDDEGNAYVTGETGSGTFPTTLGAFQSSKRGYFDAFVAKLNPTGTALVFSTYLGGSSYADSGRAIAADESGNAYVTGDTMSGDFPTTPSAFDESHNGGGGDAYAAAFGPTGAVIYSTLLGSGQNDWGYGIAADAAGNAYVTGETAGADFPTTAGAFDTSFNGGTDVFVTVLDAAGATLVYSTFIGGVSWDSGRGIALDAAGNAYITGDTGWGWLNDFPTTPGAYDATFNAAPHAGPDAFVSKLDPSGASLVYSTFLGGNGSDVGRRIAVDDSGAAHVAGVTTSDDFPTPPGAYDATFNGNYDAFAALVSPDGARLKYASFFGGSAYDEGNGLGVDEAGNAYVGGYTESHNFPATDGAYQTAFGGTAAGFVVKLRAGTGTPAVVRLQPNRGGDTSSVSAVIQGNDFNAQAFVRLVRSGQADVAGDPVNVSEDGGTIYTAFDLTGRAQGVWDLVVQNPDGLSAALPAAFTVEAGQAAQVWVDVIGREAVRARRAQPFTVLYGNSGNVDAQGVVLWISIAAGVAWELAFDYGDAAPPPTWEPPIDWPSKPFAFVSPAGGETVIPLLIPTIPPHSAWALPVRLTADFSENTEFELAAWVNPTMFGSPLKEAIKQCLRPYVDELMGNVDLDNLGTNLMTAKGNVIDLIANNAPDDQILAAQNQVTDLQSKGTVGLMVELFKTLSDQLGKHRQWVLHGAPLFDNPLEEQIKKKKEELGDEVWNALGMPAKTGAANQQVAAGAWKQLGQKCLPEEWKKERNIKVLRALDPNDKVGSVGAGEARYFSGGEALRYAVFFENVPTATAPAQEVLITDSLDPAAMDLSTVRLGPITFGDTQVVPPPGVDTFATEVDLRPTQNLIVRLNAALDPNTGLLTWRFTSLDPATGQLPDDPLAGFLPPNITPPQGEGNVLFTVNPHPALATGDEIRNRAAIVFDDNPAIETPTWLNTVDHSEPASQVLPLASTQYTTTFPVQWSGTDTGAGVRDLTVYVSENGAAFSPRLTHVVTTTATFTGTTGAAYRFYSVARDDAGNIEAAPAAPDAVTLVCAAAPNAPTLLAPANGRKIARPRVLLDWSDPPCAERYEVIVKQDGKRGRTVARKTVTPSQYTTASLPRGRPYYWRVRGCNALGCGPWTSWWRFFVK